MPLDKTVKKTLVIGSGPIVIGQAAEFDYAGTQGCRVLKEAGVNVVLVNSNPATIMTDRTFADEIYLEPLTVETLRRIIEKEKPDSLLAGLGGQTGLTLAMELAKDGFLDAHGVRLIGTNTEAIDKAEDRKLFKQTMEQIGEPTIPSGIAETVEDALAIAEKIGYPVIIRPAFTLGGTGGGVAYSEQEMREAAKAGLDASPITQILVEKYIAGWKEIEFETIRDAAGNVIAVCSMENFDPVGIHTGDSIVVAPALTLADREYQMLRSAALHIISSLNIVGGCNCQFALCPDSFEYAVIEVNPRVSRSSALASKATGYPIAKVTAKIALGYTLDEIKNDITGKTCACFEPALDYVVVKFPKWPFDKFAGASRTLGTQMKATGEVMAIGTSFEAALMKAVRGAEISLDTLNAAPIDSAPLSERLHRADDRRLFTVFEALKAGYSVDEIHKITKIDKFFLAKLQKLADFEKELAVSPMTDTLYKKAKSLGYPDAAIRRISGKETLPALAASYKMVDTCGAEFDAETPYFYATYDSVCEAREFIKNRKKETILVLGSGPIRIGQGIEFDYSSVHCVMTLKKLGYDVVIVNNNPETVSTDYDTADRLYFEPLTPEDVMNVLEIEQPVGVVCQFGGQTAIKLAKTVREAGYSILGTDLGDIDAAEDRELFNELLNRLGIPQPKGTTVFTADEAAKAAAELGYPVLVRPSYVLGGQGMEIAYDEKHIREYMSIINMNVQEHPILVDKYLLGREIEVDAICDGENVLIPGIMEHVERAGIHSGDSISVYPPQHLAPRIQRMVTDYTINIARSLHVRGLVNIQFIEYAGDLYIIEVNPRSSRTVPYISKVTGIPIVELGVRASLGEKVPEMGFGTGLYPPAPTVAVKMPVFSFEKLPEVEVSLGPEMKSTGEALGLAETAEEAYLKGFASTKMAIPKPEEGGVLFSIADHDKREALELAETFAALGFEIYATTGTAHRLNHHYVGAQPVPRPGEDTDKLAKLFDSGKIRLIIATPTHGRDPMRAGFRLRRMAVEYGIACVTSIDTAKLLMKCVKLGKKAEDVPPLGLHDLIL